MADIAPTTTDGLPQTPGAVRSAARGDRLRNMIRLGDVIPFRPADRRADLVAPDPAKGEWIDNELARQRAARRLATARTRRPALTVVENTDVRPDD
jgi:hypothetical protein